MATDTGWVVLYRLPGDPRDRCIICPDQRTAELQRDDLVYRQPGPYEQIRVAPGHDPAVQEAIHE
jgi:hypothetical protein